MDPYFTSILIRHQNFSDSSRNQVTTPQPIFKMSYYDEIEIEDMTFDPTLQIYHYPCPCGDRFEISLGDMRDGEDVGICPSCSLMIRVVFDMVGTFWLQREVELQMGAVVGPSGQGADKKL